MHGTRIVTATGNDIALAARQTGGEWSVDVSLRDRGVCVLAADPSNPAIVYAGTANEGVWRSTDGGQTWSLRGMDGVPVKSLAVSPHDAHTVYAGSKPATLFVSYDSGASWTELESFRRIPNRWWWFSPAEPPDIRPYVYDIAVSPTEPDVLLAGVEFGAVVRSEDGGRTWSRHRSGALRDCHSLKFHVADGNWAYEAGGTGGGAAVSSDGGRTFRQMKHGLAKGYGIVCAADPVLPAVWYVSVAPGPFNAFGDHPEIYLYRANEDGSWRSIGWGSDGRVPAAVTALVTVPDAPGHLYAGLVSGDVWHSADYGDTWTQMPFNLGAIWHALLVF